MPESTQFGPVALQSTSSPARTATLAATVPVEHVLWNKTANVSQSALLFVKIYCVIFLFEIDLNFFNYIIV